MTEPALQLDGVTGIVLAGGRSSRFGSDKLAAEFDGRPLLHHALAAVATVAGRILVMVAPGVEPPIPGELATRVLVVHDPEPFGGPLVGLVAALAIVETPTAIVVGGDMPRMVPAVLRRLAVAVEPGRAAAVLEVPGRLQPLPMALDAQAARAVATTILERGGRSLRDLLGDLDAASIPAPVWLSLDPEAATIVDIDRLADLSQTGGPRREPLTIAVTQPRCVPYDVAANAATHAATVRVADARVVVFPELSLTGYELDAPAVSVEDARLTDIVEACAETGSLVLAGAPVHGAAGRSHVAMLAIDGTGVTVAYRKIWLGGAEPERFSPGSSSAVLDVDGWRLGLAICRDTGIPQHAADTAALGIDAYVAGMLESADDAAVLEARAHRIATDHNVWVAIASFAGSTGGGYGRAAGRSGIWSPDGAAMARAGPETGAIGRATLT